MTCFRAEIIYEREQYSVVRSDMMYKLKKDCRYPNKQSLNLNLNG